MACRDVGRAFKTLGLSVYPYFGVVTVVMLLWFSVESGKHRWGSSTFFCQKRRLQGPGTHNGSWNLGEASLALFHAYRVPLKSTCVRIDKPHKHAQTCTNYILESMVFFYYSLQRSSDMQSPNHLTLVQPSGPQVPFAKLLHWDVPRSRCLSCPKPPPSPGSPAPAAQRHCEPPGGDRIQRQAHQ